MGWNDRMDNPEVYGPQYARDLPFLPESVTAEEEARCGVCGESADVECEDCGDDLCADDFALHMEEHEDADYD